MRKLKSGLPIYIFAFALAWGGLFFAPATAHAAETSTTASQETASSTETDPAMSSETIVSDNTAASGETVPSEDTSLPEENPSENDTSTDGSISSGDATTSQTPETKPTEEQKPTVPQKPSVPSTGAPNPPASKPAAPVSTAPAPAKKNKKVNQSNANLDRWMNICKTMGKNLTKRKFKYSNSGTRSTYKGALSSGKKSNCALYVSWCLQEYGALKKGKTFYVRSSGSIKKNFKRWGKKLKVIRVNKSCSSANLQKGDVVCWSSIGHCNIYAGRNSSGDRLWFDAGKSATYSGRSGSRFENIGAKQQGYLDSRRISYIIRIKNL